MSITTPHRGIIYLSGTDDTDGGDRLIIPLSPGLVTPSSSSSSSPSSSPTGSTPPSPNPSRPDTPDTGREGISTSSSGRAAPGTAVGNAEALQGGGDDITWKDLLEGIGGRVIRLPHSSRATSPRTEAGAEPETSPEVASKGAGRVGAEVGVDDELEHPVGYDTEGPLVWMIDLGPYTRAREGLRDKYCNSKFDPSLRWTQFNQLVGVIPPGGSLGLDDKSYIFPIQSSVTRPYEPVTPLSLFEPSAEGDQSQVSRPLSLAGSEVNGIKVEVEEVQKEKGEGEADKQKEKEREVIRFEGGTTTVEFRDLRINPRCIFESEFFHIRNIVEHLAQCGHSISHMSLVLCGLPMSLDAVQIARSILGLPVTLVDTSLPPTPPPSPPSLPRPSPLPLPRTAHLLSPLATSAAAAGRGSPSVPVLSLGSTTVPPHPSTSSPPQRPLPSPISATVIVTAKVDEEVSSHHNEGSVTPALLSSPALGPVTPTSSLTGTTATLVGSEGNVASSPTRASTSVPSVPTSPSKPIRKYDEHEQPLQNDSQVSEQDQNVHEPEHNHEDGESPVQVQVQDGSSTYEDPPEKASMRAGTGAGTGTGTRAETHLGRLLDIVRRTRESGRCGTCHSESAAGDGKGNRWQVEMYDAIYTQWKRLKRIVDLGVYAAPIIPEENFRNLFFRRNRRSPVLRSSPLRNELVYPGNPHEQY